MPGTRGFLALCGVIAGLIVIVISATTDLPLASALPAEVGRGLALWRGHDCEACHSLYGHGGPFAPDLTHIVSQRGTAYLRVFLENPAAFHPTADRQMPRFSLTVSETDEVIAFLTYVGDTSAARAVIPVAVSGGLPAVGATSLMADEASAAADPAALGQRLFGRAPANCATCHSLEPEIRIIGPSLAGIAGRAATRIAGQDAESYLRASILRPGEYVVAGYENVMAQNLGEVLSFDDVNHLIAFLLTLE